MAAGAGPCPAPDADLSGSVNRVTAHATAVTARTGVRIRRRSRASGVIAGSASAALPEDADAADAQLGLLADRTHRHDPHRQAVDVEPALEVELVDDVG